ncbi:hypothetical protein D9M71_409490 [compost metagenome]
MVHTLADAFANAMAALGVGVGHFVEVRPRVDDEGDVLAQIAAFHLLMAGEVHVDEQRHAGIAE